MRQAERLHRDSSSAFPRHSSGSCGTHELSDLTHWLVLAPGHLDRVGGVQQGSNPRHPRLQARELMIAGVAYSRSVRTQARTRYIVAYPAQADRERPRNALLVRPVLSKIVCPLSYIHRHGPAHLLK